MSKLHPSITRALTIALFVTSAFADTVTLKSGEHLEGKITKETDKDVTLEMQSGGVVDERVLPKTDIEKIDKVSPEVQAFHAIERIQLQQNSFPANQYDAYIAALQAYVTQYPNSVRAIDVQNTLNAFLEEKKRVENGEAKIDGNWLSKAEVEKEKVQIGGRLTFNYMKAQSAAGDYVGALNAFGTLEKTYPGAAVMPDAIELAQKLIPALKTEVERSVPEQKIMRDQRDKGIKAAGAADRVEMEAGAKKEDDAADAAATAADSGNRWAPLIKGNAKCLDSLKKRAVREEPRLAGLKVANMRESLQATEAARQKLTSGDVAGASASLREATTLWSANELAKRLAVDVAAQKDAASNTSAAPQPAATPAKSPGKMTPKPKASTSHPSAAAGESGAPVASKDDDDKPFYMTLPGAVGIVVGLAVVLAGANVFVKMKKRKAEQQA